MTPDELQIRLAELRRLPEETEWVEFKSNWDKAAYIKNRGLDKEHYKELVKLHLQKFGSATRQELEDWLREKISDALTEEQKANRIRNLLQEMRRDDGSITPSGRGPSATWELTTGLGGKDSLVDSEYAEDEVLFL